MRFDTTELDGAWLIGLEPASDHRGPAAEVKIVSCVRGVIYDVIVDLRERSPTCQRWQGFQLSAENRRRLYIPADYAHGFQTLSDDAEVEYLISEFYAPQHASGVRTMIRPSRSSGRCR